MEVLLPRPILALCLVLLIVSKGGAAEPPQQLWLYYPMNLLVDKNLEKAREVWQRAAAAGYDHILLADSKFARLSKMDRHYFDNCRKAQETARQLHLQLVPALFSIGYSNDLLSLDPNLAEGVPVRDTLYTVHDGVAEVTADPPVALAKPSWHDAGVSIADNVATFHSAKGVQRLVFHLKVSKFRCYHVSVKVKTDALGGHPDIVALGGNQSLQWQSLRIKPTQDWQAYDVVFDSLDHDEVNLYFGIWSDVRGSMQLKDWKIQEAALVNVLRRDGAPCIVKREDDGKTLVEGTDYEKIADPKMGRVPYEGEYESWHQPPVIHTRLPDGVRLRVSWYYPPIVYDGQVAACISDPKLQALLADQARRMKELWNAPLYMMSHDEFRCCNWDQSCESKQQTPGKMLADNLAQCTKLLRPAQAAVWSDMFDPFHNAVKGPYFLVNGPWLDSWEGLSADTLVVNWNHGKRDQSLKFFADRGNPQLIAGYYDNDWSELQDWKTSAANVHGVIGYMYTTWRGDYANLEKFAQRVK